MLIALTFLTTFLTIGIAFAFSAKDRFDLRQSVDANSAAISANADAIQAIQGATGSSETDSLCAFNAAVGKVDLATNTATTTAAVNQIIQAANDNMCN